ncbi:MAG TPA: hypothetical protein VF796_09075, partial [Humisphaera sp.]
MTETVEDVPAAAMPAAEVDAPHPPTAAGTALPVLLALSFSHLLNDTIQALIPAMYPVLKATHGLTFSEIGLITFTFQLTASLLQPLVGTYT